MGVCIGVVIGLVLIILALLWWKKKKGNRRKAVAAAAQREREIEMDGVTIRGEGSGESVETIDLVEGRRDSKDTVVVVGVEERGETGQRS